MYINLCTDLHEPSFHFKFLGKYLKDTVELLAIKGTILDWF